MLSTLGNQRQDIPYPITTGVLPDPEIEPLSGFSDQSSINSPTSSHSSPARNHGRDVWRLCPYSVPQRRQRSSSACDPHFTVNQNRKRSASDAHPLLGTSAARPPPLPSFDTFPNYLDIHGRHQQGHLQEPRSQVTSHPLIDSTSLGSHFNISCDNNTHHVGVQWNDLRVEGKFSFI